MKKRYLVVLLFLTQFTLAEVKNDSKAPLFTGIDSYGNKISLESLKGKNIILEWTNHECPFVAKHYKTGNMQSTQEFSASKGAIWITIISSAEGTQGYVSSEEANTLSSSRNAIPNHVILDEEGVIGKLYGAKTTPHMYIIDEKGFLKYQGAIDDAGGRGFMFKDLSDANNYVKSALSQLQEKIEISNKVTKPYGCSVKYKS